MSTVAAANRYDLERLLNTAQLPALPQSAIKILDLSKDPDNGPAEFAVPIECDPGLAGQVLRFVNSSYFGFSREISNVKLAITLVGVRTIKNFTLWSAVFSLMPNPKCGGLDLKCLWQDSLRRGLFARMTGKLLGLKEAEEAFAAALLQDMAIPVLVKEFQPEYAEMLPRRAAGERLSQMEQERFGWTHADAGAAMGRRWNLPDELLSPISRHTQAEEFVGQAAAMPTTQAVALSALLPATVDAAWHDRAALEELYARVKQDNWPSLVELLGKVDAAYAEFAPLLKIASPSKTLVERWTEN